MRQLQDVKNACSCVYIQVVCHYERRNAERIQIETKSYIIKELLRNCRTTEEFKKYYDYITNLMTEEKVYSLYTFIK